MFAKDPDRFAREQAMKRTDSDAKPATDVWCDKACADYNAMALDEWRAALSADLEDRFGPAPSDLSPVGEAGW